MVQSGAGAKAAVPDAEYEAAAPSRAKHDGTLSGMPISSSRYVGRRDRA
nr:hypothetical protein [Microvirga brassicacearum]